jgi:hypothetical protein
LPDQNTCTLSRIFSSNLASLQKVSHSPPNVIQREEMPRRRSHGQRPSQPDLETKDQMLQILETPLLGRQHSTVTALVRCMRFVLAAAAAKMIVGAESRNSYGAVRPFQKHLTQFYLHIQFVQLI